MIRLPRWYPQRHQLINWTVTVGSVLLCLLILPMRLPGMQLLGIAPNWLLIWVVVWSVKRTVIQGALAGLVLGLLQDGMTTLHPTHALSLTMVGILTARLQKQRYIQEDFISIALIVFGMTILAEVVTTLQFSFANAAIGATNYTTEASLAVSTLANTWTYHQQTALCSAILSSLWAPVVYYPLNRWWEKMNVVDS